ncbi:MAG: segregation/condensation protein A [Desulfobacterales bacterium]|nr:segregation/condensation protein A [Desulfobacterales bacterium]
METSQSTLYQVRLEDIFEGPMDLLLHLIKKNEMDIYDIPIAIITQQYLAYLEWMKAMNIEYAGEFIVMAATLAQIKSRLLLPAYEGDEEAEEDPRNAITRPLIEYLQMKSAARELASRDLLGDKTFVRPLAPDKSGHAAEDTEIQVGLFELIDAFRQILDNVAGDHHVDLQTEAISVKDRINQLVDLFERKPSMAFEELFEGQKTKSDIIVTFLAILEMVKINLLKVTQQVQSSVIRLFYQ